MAKTVWRCAGVRMTSHVTMSRGNVNVHQGSPAAAVRRIVLRVGLGRDVTRPVTVTRTRSVTQLLGAAAVDRATPARTAPEVVKRECLV